MRKYLVKEVIAKENKLDSIQCNKCGKEIILEKDTRFEENKITHFHLGKNCSFPYPSEFENKEVEFDLCDDCLTKIMDSFKIPARIDWIA